MIQVTFIGTGAAFSTSQRTNVALLLQEANTRILVECGPTILYQLARAGTTPRKIRYLFVSHRHGDHILGLPMFLLTRTLGGSAGPLTLLGSNDVTQAGKELTQVVYPELAKRLTNLEWLEMPFDRPASVELGPSIKLSTLPITHGDQISALASRYDFFQSGRSVVYTGDLSYCAELADFAAGCDLLVHEANFCETLEPGINPDNHGGHSTAREAGHTAARAQCGLLALVHLKPDYVGYEEQVRAEAAQEFDGKIIVPNDGASVFI